MLFSIEHESKFQLNDSKYSKYKNKVIPKRMKSCIYTFNSFIILFNKKKKNNTVQKNLLVFLRFTSTCYGIGLSFCALIFQFSFQLVELGFMHLSIVFDLFIFLCWTFVNLYFSMNFFILQERELFKIQDYTKIDYFQN